jgi:polyphosphate kinase
LIASLYEASKNNVKIDLIVRGICCLVPQVPNLSENIRVISIVGRFLEHSRVYYFYNNGDDELYLSSADLMQRNLDRRIETSFPVENEKLKRKIIDTILKTSLMDNVKAKILLPNGIYVLNRPVYTEKEISLQDWLMKQASKTAEKKKPRETVKIQPAETV